jgi:hypothetical protein
MFWAIGIFIGFWISLALGSTLGAVVVGVLVAWGVRTLLKRYPFLLGLLGVASAASTGQRPKNPPRERGGARSGSPTARSGGTP